MSSLRPLEMIYERSAFEQCITIAAENIPALPSISLYGGAQLTAVKNFLQDRSDYSVQMNMLSQLQLGMGILKPLFCLLQITDKVAGSSGIVISLAQMKFGDALSAVVSTDTNDPGLLLLLADCFSGLIPQIAMPQFMVDVTATVGSSLQAVIGIIGDLVDLYAVPIRIRAQVATNPDLEEIAICYETALAAQQQNLAVAIEPITTLVSTLSTLVAFVPGLQTALDAAGLSIAFTNPLDSSSATSDATAGLAKLQTAIDSIEQTVITLNQVIAIVQAFL